MVILPVLGQITTPLIKKYQFLIVFLEVTKYKYLENELIKIHKQSNLTIKIEFNLLKTLSYKACK